VPVASQFLDLRFVLAVFCLLDVVIATRVLADRPRAVIREEAARLIPGCVAGVALGALLLAHLPAAVLMLLLGAFSLGYGAWSLALPGALPLIGAGWAWVAGVSGGVTSAMFGAGGPPYAIYLSLRPHPVERMRATLAAVSTVSIAARIVAFAAAGMLSDPRVWWTALFIVPASLVALALARRVGERLSREAVLKCMRWLLCAAGAALILRVVAAG
jgi:hypothetical protein